MVLAQSGPHSRISHVSQDDDAPRHRRGRADLYLWPAAGATASGLLADACLPYCAHPAAGALRLATSLGHDARRLDQAREDVGPFLAAGTDFSELVRADCRALRPLYRPDRWA